MGAWGTGLFENDGALDFLGDLEEAANGWALIRQTLAAAAKPAPDEDVGASESEGALAAAECVAVARGKPSGSPKEGILSWCRSHPLKDASDLATLAVEAVRRIRTSSELKELWDDADDPEWDAAVADLEKRLL